MILIYTFDAIFFVGNDKGVTYFDQVLLNRMENCAKDLLIPTADYTRSVRVFILNHDAKFLFAYTLS